MSFKNREKYQKRILSRIKSLLGDLLNLTRAQKTTLKDPIRFMKISRNIQAVLLKKVILSKFPPVKIPNKINENFEVVMNFYWMKKIKNIVFLNKIII